MAKQLRIGSLRVSQQKFINNGQEVEKTMVSLALGNLKNKDSKYDLNVKVIITDNTGKVVHTQENGFISLIDPRTQPDELAAGGFISSEEAALRNERLKTLPKEIKYQLQVKVV